MRKLLTNGIGALPVSFCLSSTGNVNYYNKYVLKSKIQLIIKHA